VFLGHYGLAFAAKRVAPKTSLGTLTLAGNLADCVWPILLLLGVERMRVVPGYTAYTPFAFDYYPWSHSLAIEAAAGLVLGLVVFAFQKDVRGAVVAGLLVPSHWFLDIPFHRPDLPLYPGGPKLGFGLWNSVSLSVLAEVLVFGGGVYLYLRTTRAKDTIGTAAFWVLVFLLFAIAASSALERPPDSPTAVAFSALGLWVLVPWTYWIDRHRSVRAHAAPRG
jgi:hypothetical protein